MPVPAPCLNRTPLPTFPRPLQVHAPARPSSSLPTRPTRRHSASEMVSGKPTRTSRMGPEGACHSSWPGLSGARGCGPSTTSEGWALGTKEEKKRKKGKLLSHIQLFVTPRTVTYQGPLSMGFPRQEHWSVLPFPCPGDLPIPGIEPGSPVFQADALPSEPPRPWKAGLLGPRKRTLPKADPWNVLVSKHFTSQPGCKSIAASNAQMKGWFASFRNEKWVQCTCFCETHISCQDSDSK